MGIAESSRAVARFLALNRTVGIVLVSVLFFGLGEQLWSQFMPMYLEAQSKAFVRSAEDVVQLPWSILATVGIYACLRNFIEGFCYIGGGQLTARVGDRGSLMLIGVFTLAGYGLFLATSSPWLTVLAALFIMGWEPLSVAVTFTTVGSTVSSDKRGMAFAVQSIQKRLPKIIGPALAGLVLGAAEAHWGAGEGRILGMRLLVGLAFVLGVVSIAIQARWMPHHELPPPGPSGIEIVRAFDLRLRRLLLAEVFTRWCDWLVREFVVFYVMLVRGASWETMGGLFALQNLTALLTYLPIGLWTQSAGLRPFVGVTFVFFALFPLVLAAVPDGAGLAVAFVVYGLREIGEPARKALITSLLPLEVRARGVGLYWGIRSFAMCTAPLAGAAIWHVWGPQALLYVAFGLGCIGAALYYFFDRRPALFPDPAVQE